MGSQLLVSKLLRHFNMKPLIILGLVAFVRAQYSGETQDLSNSQLDALKDIFGDAAAGGAYSGQQVGRLEGGTNGVKAIIQVVKNEEGYVAPDDYQTTAGLTDKATTNVDNVFENCADYTATQGYECVPYYQCHNGTIITDGGGLIDIRNGFGILSPEDSKCPGFLDVCCLDPDFIPPPPPPIVKHVPKCGQRHENGLGVRIQGFNEYESQFGEWPHMCAVLAEEPVAQDPGYAGEPQTVNLYQCGGSLIAPGVILTAAHCAAKFQQEPTKLKIRCGEWDTQNQTEPRPHQDRYVQNLANDWAVLYTSQDFDLQAHIDTICLPQPEELFNGQTCFATGWGKDQFGAAGNYQVVLKEIDLPVVGHDQCEASLRTTRLGKRFQLDDSFICAGGVDGKDTCKGDGGSPLVCQSKFDPTSYVQAGIVAWGIGCGEDNTPSAFLSQKSSLISKHALPQDGVSTSLELLETTRWFSRRSTYQLSATTSARPPSGPPDLARDSSWTIRLSALAELTARTPAREMVEAPLSARASLTQLPTSRLVSLPGVLAVARTTHLVSMPLCPRVSAGLTTPWPVNSASRAAPTPATGATQLSSARPGWTESSVA